MTPWEFPVQRLARGGHPASSGAASPVSEPQQALQLPAEPSAGAR